MSAVDLRSLLMEPGQAGAYFIDARDTEAMVEAGEALEFAVARIDLRDCLDKATLLQRFQKALRFPDWFGDNWDALADSLGDLSWWPAPGYLLLIEQAGAWQAQASEDAQTLIDLLNDVAQDWAETGTPFWALLPLPETQLRDMEP